MLSRCNRGTPLLRSISPNRYRPHLSSLRLAMPVCPTCRRELPDAVSVCPACGSPIETPDEDDGWVTVARVNNLAESGYFADLLAAREIESQVEQFDDFSAVDGSWQRTYVIRVRQADGQSSADAIQEELARAGSDEDAGEFSTPTPSDFSPVAWMPLALMLIAGGLLYWNSRGGRLPGPERIRQVERSDALWRALTASEHPLIERNGAGDPQRTLHYDEQSDMLILDEDLDGDGLFDRRREFQRGRLIRETRR